MQYFTPQLHEDPLRSRSLRASQYARARKTTDKTNTDDSHTDVQDTTTQEHPGTTVPEIAQLRVAGLLPDPDLELPPAPFPHAPAPARVERELDGPASVQEEMARAPSRLYAVNATSKSAWDGDPREADKKAALDKVSTLMHLCLLKGDYERAGRAWGAILRTHIAGRPVDPRNHGRWGIGAEIALRRNPLSCNETSQSNPQHNEIGRFSEEGFELARKYYERLILKHPSRKQQPQQPHSADERVFYPPMFSLWIYEICEKSKRARTQLQDELVARSRSSRSSSVDSIRDEPPSELHAKEEAIRREEFAQAIQIAKRLDEHIASPRFDRQASILQLRGNVALWIADLTLGKTGSNDDWDTDSFTNLQSAADQLKRLTNAQRELEAAQDFFERATRNGGDEHTATLSSINSKHRELGKHIEKLNPHQQNQ
ncbi:Transcription initiation factor Rrn11 [Pyrenophora seminiperda CCB06]|uniref:Transcription initiation factor Rrn11 n=1 Tax=Pyrenophora seminiperda CCB06 TaxID=1302712 RepID=A0A3M7MGB3_9PLEO|nr:Transcription initiation factor Rrn11 [Pyrenophora seminiperda CCB06]